MKIIDADALLKHEIKRCDGEMPFIGTCSTNNFTLKSEINKFPTIDAVPVVHGQWIKHPHKLGFFICSYCKCLDEKYIPFDEKVWNYCPNCGAKMDGDAE